MDIEALMEDAFAHLGVEMRVRAGGRGARADLALQLEGVDIPLRLERRSLVDTNAADRLIAEHSGSDERLIVVGDRVTEEARRHLLAAGAGYLDLRGHLALRATGILINSDVPAVKDERERTDPLAGKVGVEAAIRLLMVPTEPAAVRPLARELGRSASTVSDVLGALRRDGLIDRSNTVSDTSLFWRVAETWPRRRTFVAVAPSGDDRASVEALRLRLDDVEAPGWALTDTAAAAVYGAPVAYRAGQQLDFLVPDESVLQRAVRLLGVTESASKAAASIRVAPVPIATRQRVEAGGPGGWPLAHPLFVALDLAQDVNRGREILDAWNPDDRWTRVW